MKLRDFLGKLEYSGRLRQIRKPVSPDLDAAAVIYGSQEKPIMFHNISEARYPLVAGLC